MPDSEVFVDEFNGEDRSLGLEGDRLFDAVKLVRNTYNEWTRYKSWTDHA